MAILAFQRSEMADSAAQRAPLSTLAVRWLAASALAMVNILLFMLILFVASLTAPMGQFAGGLQGLAAAPDRLASTIATRSNELRQEIVDRLDPAHPPRYPIAYDVEFSALARVGIGDVVAASPQTQRVLVDVRRRADATTREQATYAVIRQRLIQPRVTTLFGVPIRADNGEVERVLYQGESFVIGDAAYKVNWVSQGPSEIAIAQYRRPEERPATVKFTAP